MEKKVKKTELREQRKNSADKPKPATPRSQTQSPPPRKKK